MTKNILVKSLLTISLLTVGATSLYAWTGATVAPPGSNATTPINTGSLGLGTSQTKYGSLFLNRDSSLNFGVLNTFSAVINDLLTATKFRLIGDGSVNNPTPAVGNILTAVDTNGNAKWGPAPTGGSGITSITSGGGVTASTPVSGVVTLNTDTASTLQKRISTTCATGFVMKGANADGTPNCVTDATGSGGGITSVVSGGGVTASTASGVVTLGITDTVLQKRVTGTPCTSGISNISATGAVTCATAAGGNDNLGNGTALNVALNARPLSVTNGADGNSGTQYTFLAPVLGSGSFNPISQSGDAGMFFADNKGFVIAPWSGTSKGIRITGNGDLQFKDGSVQTSAPSNFNCDGLPAWTAYSGSNSQYLHCGQICTPAGWKQMAPCGSYY